MSRQPRQLGASGRGLDRSHDERPNWPRMILSAILSPASEGGYVAFNPETGCTTQGESVPEALANLKEATELYMEEFPTEEK